MLKRSNNVSIRQVFNFHLLTWHAKWNVSSPFLWIHLMYPGESDWTNFLSTTLLLLPDSVIAGFQCNFKTNCKHFLLVFGRMDVFRVMSMLLPDGHVTLSENATATAVPAA